MDRAALIYNPIAGMRARHRRVRRLVDVLRRAGVEVRPAPTEGPGHASQIAAEIAASGSEDAVLVFGGDGTLREAARSLVGTPIAVAPLSGGTTNVVARAIGLPVDPLRAAGALLDARPMACRVGLCNDEPFLILASLGIDAAIMGSISSRAKNLGGRAAVVLAGLGELGRYRFPETSWEAEGESGRAAFVAASNIAEYGGDFRLAPGAGFLRRRLRLVTFSGRTRGATMAFGLNVLLGRHLRMASVSCRPVRELRIAGPVAAPLQLDGDFMRLEPPLTIRKSRRQLNILMPGETPG